MRSSYFLPSLFSITLLVLIAFSVLQWLNMPVGTLVDWVIGIAVAWWLLAITVIPWNMHFTAKEVVHEAAASTDKGIPVNPKDVAYAARLAKGFFWLSISLHFISAVALYLLAYYQITPLGYLAALAALLLTFLRPLHRLYAHIAHRLQQVRQQITYPREDVHELRGKVTMLEEGVAKLTTQLNTEDEYSWASQVQRDMTDLKARIEKVHVLMDEAQLQNAKEHERLARKGEADLARLSEDAQFLNQVRDLVRFIKQA